MDAGIGDIVGEKVYVGLSWIDLPFISYNSVVLNKKIKKQNLKIMLNELGSF